MHTDNKNDSLKTLQEIHSMMERSARFMSLSGWSGVWAGGTALAGAAVAKFWLSDVPDGYYDAYRQAVPVTEAAANYQALLLRFVILAMVVLIVAIIGGYYFTWRKMRATGDSIWNPASRRMLLELAIPLATGGIFAFVFLYRGLELYIPSICLVFYGLGLINGSKYTLSDIKYLGLLEVILGLVCLFAEGYGLLFWTIGFGVLHVLYGIAMWNKYDKRLAAKE